MPPAENITRAAAPFNKHNADVILRTSDQVDFHVHKAILGFASPFFEDMFELPQPSQADEAQSTCPDTGLPIVEVTEDSETLDLLLRLCYPIDDPLLDKHKPLGRLLNTAMKYQMQRVVTQLLGVLKAMVPRDPLRAYFIACSASLEDEAHSAAIAFSGTLDYFPLMTYGATAGAYYRLLLFRDTISPSKSLLFRVPEPPSLDTTIPPSGKQFTVPDPFNQPSLGSDIVLRSSEGDYFFVHKTILRMACNSELELAQLLGQSLSTTYEDREVVSLPDTSQILCLLLQLTYPVQIDRPSFPVDDPWVISELLASAKKYGLTRAAQAIRTEWEMMLRTVDPLGCFFVAVRRNWDGYTHNAECYAAMTCTMDSYHPQMEFVPPSVYRAFLRYRWDMRKAVYTELRKEVDEPLQKKEVHRSLYWGDHDGYLSRPLMRAVLDGLCLLRPSSDIYTSAGMRSQEKSWSQYLGRITTMRDAASTNGSDRRTISQIEDDIRRAFMQVDPKLKFPELDPS
ncbi:uncharacterized protein LAESUDRAFT_814392 [Laetiporus sulphureus 93-53]|uniref:BTB domain-containing protein n=1 Tax=Laetiporus sulphureus 93-53 TaxID=1314785 RepID=A0A165D251_9APHY|nr:uncharacterized protein LAESUDRAFT_814392 [Laetiporus sulphureus 93-53]KZT04004.1 hypothetical protein LAESUDRAFT_814392 [Laetiporus sulphureus 93-53]